MKEIEFILMNIAIWIANNDIECVCDICDYYTDEYDDHFYCNSTNHNCEQGILKKLLKIKEYNQ